MLALIAVNKVGNRMGKASMAVKVELLSVLEAIAETSVRVVEIPRLPSKITSKKRAWFSIGLFNKTENKK